MGKWKTKQDHLEKRFGLKKRFRKDPKLAALCEGVFEEISPAECSSCSTIFSRKSLNKLPLKGLPENLNNTGLKVDSFDLQSSYEWICPSCGFKNLFLFSELEGFWGCPNP